MDSVVIYASTSGNTRAVAEVIAEELRARGTARVLHVSDATPSVDADLIVVGGPTEGHTMTKPMAAWLDRLDAGTVATRRFAAFDTRLRWPRFLSGSAAEDIAKRIEQLGGRMVVPPQSFMVSMKPELEPGELERAGAWAAALSDAMAEVGAAHPA